jgi:hypothetical protein
VAGEMAPGDAAGAAEGSPYQGKPVHPDATE